MLATRIHSLGVLQVCHLSFQVRLRDVPQLFWINNPSWLAPFAVESLIQSFSFLIWAELYPLIEKEEIVLNSYFCLTGALQLFEKVKIWYLPLPPKWGGGWVWHLLSGGSKICYYDTKLLSTHVTHTYK